jgi:hypothetical protein
MRYPLAARRRIAFPAALFLAAVAVLGAWPLHVLLIEDVPGTRPVLVQRVQPGQQFSLGFLHSVEKCRVWDHLTISPA